MENFLIYSNCWNFSRKNAAILYNYTTHCIENNAFVNPWYRVCAHQELRNVCFPKNLACFIFLLPLFWDSPFSLITDNPAASVQIWTEAGHYLNRNFIIPPSICYSLNKDLVPEGWNFSTALFRSPYKERQSSLTPITPL